MMFGPPPGRGAGIDQRHLEALVGGRGRFHEAVIDEIGDRGHAGAREFRQIAVVVIAAPGLIRPGEGIADQSGETGQHARQRRQAADAERIEPPQRIHQGNGDEAGRDHRPAQVRKDREQERHGVAIDHHQVDEVRGHLHDVVLELRQQHQHHDQRQRQRARQRRPAQQRDEEEIEDAPGQQEADARRRNRFRCGP